ncbi:MAG: putative enzyme related to lactoylglutathione lyase [Glaciecola sp.]|jgi:predicted enzyme related to lactoylglutathione lyase
MKHNMVVWFEIPVSDMDKAKAFTKLFLKLK